MPLSEQGRRTHLSGWWVPERCGSQATHVQSEPEYLRRASAVVLCFRALRHLRTSVIRQAKRLS